MQFMGRKLRHELKYFLHLHTYADLRRRVAVLFPRDPHSVGADGYSIRSLYFEGPHDQALFDKRNGIFSREKFRIRIYNGCDRFIRLERKSRYGEWVSKESAPLTREEYDRLLAGDGSFLQTGPKLRRDFYDAIARRGYKPSVIVDYVREAYFCEPGGARITFDKRLSAAINSTDLFDPGMVTVEALDHSLTIMEIKYDAYLPEFVRLLVQSDAQRSAISKYAICRELFLRHHSFA
jgi:hypothetical protein